MGGATCQVAANQCDSWSPLVRIVLWNVKTTPIFLMRESVATVLSFVVLILPANTGRTWQRNDKTPCFNITHTRKKSYMLPWVSYLFLVALLICILILGPPWPVGCKLSYNHTYFINSSVVSNCRIKTWDMSSDTCKCGELSTNQSSDLYGCEIKHALMVLIKMVIWSILYVSFGW